MGLFDTFLTIGTTVGKICGALSGAQGSQSTRFVDFGAPGDIAPQIGQIVFYVADDGTTHAMNQATGTEWGLSIPTDPTLGSLSTDLIFPAASNLNVSPAFIAMADNDVDNFTLFPMSSNSAAGTTPGNVRMHASTTQVAAPGVTIPVGPYLTAALNVSDRTVAIGVVGGIALAAIVLLNIRGAGRTLVSIIQALKKSGAAIAGDSQPITVAVPAGIDISGGLTFIEVDAEIANFSGSVAKKMSSHSVVGKPRPLTAADHERLHAMAKSRRK